MNLATNSSLTQKVVRHILFLIISSLQLFLFLGLRMLPKVRAFPARAVLNDRTNVSGCESSPTENRAAG